ATLFVGIGKTFLYLGIEFGVHKVQKRKKGPKGVPKSSVRIHISGQYLPVIGTIVNYLAIFIIFKKLPGKQQRSIETGIKGPELVHTATFYFNSSQFLVPTGPSFFLNSVKIIGTEFL